MSSRAGTKRSSRERARLRRTELDADRARRDAAIEEAAAAFYEAEDARAEILSKLDELDQARGRAVATLADLKETNQRIGQLLEIPTAEVRRLRELIEAAAAEAVVTETADSIAAPATSADAAPGSLGTPDPDAATDAQSWTVHA